MNDKSLAIFEFEWMALGLLFVLLKSILLRVLRRKLVEALLPDNVRILIRYATKDVIILREIYLNDMYERHYHPEVGDVVFDVGSHIGIFTLKTSKLVGTNGQVYAFEPEPENFTLLKRNLALNEVTNVKVFKKAVNSSSRTLNFHVDPFNTGAGSVQLTSGRTSKISVSSVSLDQIIRKYNIKDVDFLKMDVEGHELEVLRGADRFLNICEHIAMETHEREGGPFNTQIIEVLRKKGFRTELVRYSKNNDVIYGWR